MDAGEPETVGFIDVGTNSIHVLVVRFYRGSVGTPVFQDKEPVRLGKSLYSSGSIDNATIMKSAMVLSRFVAIAKSMGAKDIIVYATCAAREASNSDVLLRVLRKHADVQVISGLEEARLIALGVFGSSGPSKRTVVMDIGGGSTEVVLGDWKDTFYRDSLALGTVRFAFGMGIDCARKVSDKDYRNMCRSVESSSYHAVRSLRELGFEEAVGSSGTMINLAEMCAYRRGDMDSGYMTLSELTDLMKSLRSVDAETRLGFPGMGKNRSDIIIPGGAIAETLMRLLGIDRITISRNGLKQGMLIDYVDSKGLSHYSTRDASVIALAERCHYDRQHAENVRSMALSMYDQMTDEGTISMPDDMRSLLESACILHDIGEFVSFENHQIISQSIIEWSNMPGFTIDEVRKMGIMVRLHHKKLPPMKDQVFSKIPKDEVPDVIKCAMLLRMADILDGHRTSLVSKVDITHDGKEVTLSIWSRTDPGMEIWRLEKMRSDFRKVFGCPLRAVWMHDAYGLTDQQ
jgi:exopolyphosphatase/guanosine-5'-triphosphate,3'-diphosphate pyrophosphatase